MGRSIITVNAFVLPKLFDNIGDIKTAFPLGILAFFNSFWVLCSLQSHISIRALTIANEDEKDMGQDVINRALGKNSFSLFFRPTKIMCWYIPSFALISVTLMWFDLIAGNNFVWSLAKSIFYQKWFVFFPIFISFVVFILLLLCKYYTDNKKGI
jgi:hypothetical protein